MEQLYPYMAEIENLCRQYNVKTLYAFGSVLTDRFNSDSDVDLIVDFREIPLESYADNYFDSKYMTKNQRH
jgi:predicted nucleotidyltransferase